MLTIMNELDTTRESLNRQLDDVLTREPLAALSAIGGVQRDMAARQGPAVRVAVQRHSWAEIGEALGVSKQAAHQKFAKEWARTLKEEVRAEQRAAKLALRKGEHGKAGAAEARRDALIAEIRNAGRRRK
jgi:hypothetical protein